MNSLDWTTIQILNETCLTIFVEKFFLDDPEMKDKVAFNYLSHKEKYEEAIRKSVLVFKKIKALQEQGRGGVDIYM